MSFSTFRPISTIEKYYRRRCAVNEQTLTDVIRVLSFLDVKSIKDEDLNNFTKYWCRSLMQVNLDRLFINFEIQDYLTSAIINLAEIALLLHERLRAANLPSLEPVLVLMGLSDDIFNDIDPPKYYPICQPKNLDSINLFFEIHRKMELIPKPLVSDLFNFSIEIAARAHKISQEDEIYGYVFNDDEIKGITLEMISSEENFEKISNQLSKYPIITFLIVLFVYEHIYKVKVPLRFEIPGFYQKVIKATNFPEKSTLYWPLFAMVNSEQIPFSEEINPHEFIALSLCHAFIPDETIPFKLIEKTKMAAMASYVFYLNSINDKTNILSRFFEQPLPDSSNDIINAIKNFLNMNEPIDKLLEKVENGDSDAAKTLFHCKVDISKLNNDKNIYHQILKILLNDDLKFDDPTDIDELTHIKLLKLLTMDKVPNEDFIIKMLKALYDKLIEITPKEKLYLTMCNCYPIGYEHNPIDIPLPSNIDDFIISLPLKPFLSYSHLVYVAVLCLKNYENDELLNLLVEFSLHFYLNGSNCSYLRDFLNDEMPFQYYELRKSRRLFYLMKSLEDQNTRYDSLKSLAPIFDDSDTSYGVAKYLLSLNDNKAFATFLELSPISASLIANRLDQETQYKVLEILFKQDAVDMVVEYAKIISAIDEKSKTAVLELLCSNALEHPKCVAQVFSAINPTNADICEILNHLPAFSNEVSNGFVHLLKKLLSALPISLVENKAGLPDSQPVISAIWNDDINPGDDESNTKAKDETIDIWTFPEHPQKCISLVDKSDNENENHSHIEENYDDENQNENETVVKKKPMFWCYTCGITGDEVICEHCAEYCHFGHDLAFAMTFERLNCFCAPSGHCKMSKDGDLPKEFPVLPNEKNANDEKESKLNEIPNSALLKLFLNISSSKISQDIIPSSSGLLSSEDILNLKEINIQKYASENRRKTSDIAFKAIPSSPKLVSVLDMVNVLTSRIDSSTHFMRRTAVTPLHLVEMAGPSRDILISCYGKKLFSYSFKKENYEIKQLHQFQIDYVGLQIAVCELDPSVIAISSLYNVVILTVDSEGSFRVTNEIELMLEDLGINIFVNSVFWVPMQVMHLAVVCNAFVKIYDVPSDCFSPVSCFIPIENLYFTSAAFVALNDVLYGIFGFSNGKIATQETDVGASLGPVNVTNFLNFKWKNIPQPPIISYCEDSDLLFISSPGCDLFISRLSQVINKEIDVVSIQLGDFNKSFKFIYKVGNTHFFEHTSSGAVMTAVFSKNEVVISLLSKAFPNSSIHLFEGSSIYLSTIEIQGEIYAISPSSGKLMTIVPATEASEDDEEADDSENNDDDKNDTKLIPNIRVPARFWANCRISTNDLSLVEPRSSKDVHDLLSGSRFIFDHRLKHKVMNIQSTNPNQLVVGFRVFLGASAPYHRPPWVMINGRRTDVNCLRAFMLPLKPKEVRPKAINRIELGSNNGYGINCDRVDVFIIDQNKLPAKYAILNQPSFDWLTLGNSVFDFVDSPDKNNKAENKDIQTDKIVSLMNLCSQCISSISIQASEEPKFSHETKDGNDQTNAENKETPKEDKSIQANETELSEEELRKIVRLMYMRNELSIACRRIIVKRIVNQDAAVKIWADEIVKCVQDKVVAKESWELLWRDVSILPSETLSETLSRIWEADPTIEGPFTVISAFMTK